MKFLKKISLKIGRLYRGNFQMSWRSNHVTTPLVSSVQCWVLTRTSPTSTYTPKPRIKTCLFPFIPSSLYIYIFPNNLCFQTFLCNLRCHTFPEHRGSIQICHIFNKKKSSQIKIIQKKIIFLRLIINIQ